MSIATVILIKLTSIVLSVGIQETEVRKKYGNNLSFLIGTFFYHSTILKTFIIRDSLAIIVFVGCLNLDTATSNGNKTSNKKSWQISVISIKFFEGWMLDGSKCYWI